MSGEFPHFIPASIDAARKQCFPGLSRERRDCFGQDFHIEARAAASNHYFLQTMFLKAGKTGHWVRCNSGCLSAALHGSDCG